jgi:hypothetical protein
MGKEVGPLRGTADRDGASEPGAAGQSHERFRNSGCEIGGKDHGQNHYAWVQRPYGAGDFPTGEEKMRTHRLWLASILQIPGTTDILCIYRSGKM